MATKKKSSLRKSGLSQRQRHLYNLSAVNNPIENYDIYGLYNYMYNLASEFNYYDSANQIAGDWQDFFYATADLAVFLNSTDKYAANINAFENLSLGIQLAESDEQLLKAANKLLNYFNTIVKNIRKIRQQFDRNQPITGQVAGLAQQIETFEEIFQRIKRIYLVYSNEFGDAVKTDLDFSDVILGPDPEKDFAFDKGLETSREKINYSLPFFRELLDQIRLKFSGFLAAVHFYLKSYNITSENNPPHTALLFAFIHLYQHLQRELNNITQKHLDFFYGSILNLTPLPPARDNVDIFLVNDPMIPLQTIHQGERLKADIGGGKSIFYEIEDHVTTSKASIVEMCMLYIARESWYGAHLYELNPYQLSETLPLQELIFKGNVVPLAKPIFGEDQNKLIQGIKSMHRTLVQSIIASPLLFLEEGDRVITVTLYLNSDSAASINNFIAAYEKNKNLNNPLQTINFEQASYELLNEAFFIDYTTSSGWERATKTRYNYDRHENVPGAAALEIKLELPPGAPGICEYAEKIHGNIPGLAMPALRITIDSYTFLNPVSFLNTIKTERIGIKASVTGASNLRFQNSTGLLSAAYAFQIFGPQPLPGTYLEVRNSNIFNRYLKSLKLNINWIGLPTQNGGFSAYYEDYGQGMTSESFKVSISSAQGSKIIPQTARKQEFGLFTSTRNADGKEFLNSKTQLTDIDLMRLEFSDMPSLSAEGKVTDSIRNQQSLRIELTSPLSGFGSKVYPQLLTDVALHNNKRFVAKKAMPHEPYIPMAKSFQADYILEHVEVINNGTGKNDSEAVKVIHIHPFGWDVAYPNNRSAALTLFPSLESERNLYLGIAESVPGQALSMYFHLADNTEIDKANADIQIAWSFLHNNTWVEFDDSSILSDSTGGMISSGIVSIRLPQIPLTGNTVMRPNLSWIRASVNGFDDLKSRIFSVYTNAAKAVRVYDVTDEQQVFTLPAFSIKSFAGKISGIKQVIQPFMSVNGRAQEKTNDFYTRVSERLRHKDRPETCQDIEQYILQNFPELFMVKCVNGTEGVIERTQANSMLKIIVIPDPGNLEPRSRSRPRVNMATLYRIREAMKKKLSPFIDIEVANPLYEEVKFKFTVIFFVKDGKDEQHNLNQLYHDIQVFFCPWLSGAVQEIQIGSKIYMNDLLSYLKSLNYIKAITDISVAHFYSLDDGTAGDTTYHIDDLSASKGIFMQGSIPGAILIPASKHLITVADKRDPDPKTSIGIGDLAIGSELLITDSQKAVFSLDQYEFRSDGQQFNLTIDL